MKKKIIATLTCLMMCSVFLFSGFTSNAQIGSGDDALDFYVPYSRPQGDGVGYLSLVVQNRDTKLNYLLTFYWCLRPYSEYNNKYDLDQGCDAVIGIEGDAVFIELFNHSNDMIYVGSLGRYSNGTNDNQVLYSGILSNTSVDYTYNIDYGAYGFDIIGYEVGGAYVISTSGVQSPMYAPRIHWNQEVGFDVYADILTYLAKISVQTEHLSNMALNSSASRKALEDIRDSLKLQLDSIEQGQMDDFKNESSVQSNEIDSLNQQNQVNKPDVDSVSQQVDSVLDVEPDANYGMLLSSLTSNNRVLTMMLVCSAIALISFVLFGKR